MQFLSPVTIQEWLNAYYNVLYESYNIALLKLIILLFS